MASSDRHSAPSVGPADGGSNTYSDGSPIDQVHYLECKLILKPDRFTSAKVFLDYGKLVEQTAEQFHVDYSHKGVVLKPQVREVEFFDTSDFRLYNNAFILRRRVKYEDGFPTGDPEIVFKFRHSNLDMAARLDVRPQIAGIYRTKFKAEALPLKDQVGGYRILYSHNAVFGMSQAPEGDRTSLAALSTVFPPLRQIMKSDTDRVEMVNETIVEEVLQELGTLDFGKGITADTNVAIWRERGTHRPLCGEFSFQAKFNRRDDLHDKALDRCKKFFITLQQSGRDWLMLGTTKTGLVYRLKGNPPQAHE